MNILPVMADAINRAPSGMSESIVVLQPKARLPENSSFSKMGRIFGALYGIWTEPEADKENLSWVRGTIDSLIRTSVGGYTGYADMGRPGHQHATHSDAALVRLADLSQLHDPDGLFAGRVPDAALA